MRTPPQDRLEWLPAHALAGTIWVGPLGELARIELDGELVLLRSDPCGAGLRSSGLRATVSISAG